MIALVTTVPSGALHEIVKVLSRVNGRVEAFPESVLCEKLLSDDVSVQSRTPCELQKIEVREPSATLSGTAQISTPGGTSEVNTEDVDIAGAIGFCTNLT